MTIIHRIRRIAGAAAVCLTVLLATSCSPGSPGGVKGKITVNGKPIARGLITFLPESGNKDPQSAAIIDGEYDTGLTVIPGPAKIYIIPSSTKPEEAAGGGNDLVPTPKATKVDPNAVPTKYQNAETSGLTITVKSGQTVTFDKDLTP